MSDRPNILLLFADQLRFDAIQALGNSIVRTPNLDRLCREGVTFTRCYTPSPVCVPARAALVSGLPPHCTGCWDNGTNIDPEVPSFMGRLTELGYRTHGVGKMHFTPRRERLWGFETRDVSERGNDDYRQFLDQHGYGHVLEVHGALSEMYTIPQISQMPASLHETAWVADRSISFLDQRDRSRPFFLWSSFFSPHPPFNAPTPWNFLYWAGHMPAPFLPEGYEDLLNYWNHSQNRAKYRDKGNDEWLMRTIKAIYYASISFVDYHIGRILDALGDDLENTLIVFTSDHGELLGDYGCLGKRSMMDVSSRVPLLIRWPRGENACTCYEGVTSLLDLHPTFLSCAGDQGSPVYSGSQDLTSVSTGNMETDRVVFSQLQTDGLGLHMAVNQNSKYVYSAADEREWFFDLEADPYESRDFSRIDSYTENLVTLRRSLIEHYQRDGYDSVLDDGNWRRFGKTKIPAQSEASVLVQHPKGIQKILEGLGPYAPDEIPGEYWMGKSTS